jgi:hypothetical protein
MFRASGQGPVHVKNQASGSAQCGILTFTQFNKRTNQFEEAHDIAEIISSENLERMDLASGWHSVCKDIPDIVITVDNISEKVTETEPSRWRQSRTSMKGPTGTRAQQNVDHVCQFLEDIVTGVQRTEEIVNDKIRGVTQTGDAED